MKKENFKIVHIDKQADILPVVKENLLKLKFIVADLSDDEQGFVYLLDADGALIGTYVINDSKIIIWDKPEMISIEQMSTFTIHDIPSYCSINVNDLRSDFAQNVYIPDDPDDIEKEFKIMKASHKAIVAEYIIVLKIFRLLQELEDLKIQKPYIETYRLTLQKEYDPNFGDQKVCQCGHNYDMHFPAFSKKITSCKFCNCRIFQHPLNKLKQAK